MSWRDDYKGTRMMPTLTRAPHEMERIKAHVDETPQSELVRLGRIQVLMFMGWLQLEYEETQNPCAVWEAWGLCREVGKPPPAWLLGALDEMADLGLGSGFTRQAQRQKTHMRWVANSWLAVQAHWRQEHHPGEPVGTTFEIVGKRAGASASRVRDAYYQLKSTLSEKLADSPE